MRLDRKAPARKARDLPQVRRVGHVPVGDVMANGWAVKKSQVGKNAEPAPVAAPRQRITCPASHPNLRDVRGELRCYR